MGSVRNNVFGLAHGCQIGIVSWSQYVVQLACRALQDLTHGLPSCLGNIGPYL